MDKFDLMVIGSGSGLEISVEASERGMSVALVEEGPFGGTCLNRGCIPSKMLIHCADIVETIKKAHLFGIEAHLGKIDWDFIIKRTFEEIDQDAEAIESGNRDSENITVFKGSGRFVAEKTLEVNGQQITADTILIAACTRPWVPPIPGLDQTAYITSDQALRLPQQPKRMAIVGGGYIAAEMAHFFCSLGTEVTLIHRRSTMLREEDEAIAQRFTQVYQEKMNLLLNSEVAEVQTKGGEINLKVSVEHEGQQHSVDVAADTHLMATGRVPNTDLLEVANTGVELDDRGYIKTDQYLETNVPGIWALGDIVGKYVLKHSANLEAAYAANNIFHSGHKEPVDYRAMPHAVFASPQVASVGLTEELATRMDVEYLTSTYNYSDTAYGSSIQDHSGFVKVLAHPETREILGCHIIGPEASILIQEAANAMRVGLPTEAITQSIYVHPAMPEVV